jgi:site-specific DNA-cytosine methylase
MKEEINVMAICSGIGGIELGLSLALQHTRTVCYVERDVYCAAVLAQRMQDNIVEPSPIHGDLKTFDGRPWRGVVDIVTAGYPCQPFSTAGKRRGSEDPRHLWPNVYRVLREIRPQYMFCENVSAHLRLGFDHVVRDLGEAHYRVAAGIFTAWAIGAPHQRERLFFLAALLNRVYAKSGLGFVQNRKEKVLGHSREKRLLRERRPLSLYRENGRNDDGLPSRMDRSRALGNAVVPQMASRAFTTLWRTLHA